MSLTVTTTHRPATDLGYLLHKNPACCQSFPLSFGSAHVFYPVVATIEVLPCRGGEDFLREVFNPLGYEVQAIRYPLDETFPDWGPSRVSGVGNWRG